jgi:hypothetical protein
MGDSSDGVTGTTAGQAQVLAGHAGFLITAAVRAPSVHNTQPWRFRAGPDAVELWTDPRRKLRADPSGREMLISCGAAVFGLRLAVRSLGYLPVTELLPDPAQLRLAARIRTGAAAPVTGLERQMLDAVPHRHTHRGPFAPGPLPHGLLAGLQHDALAEGATLVLVTGGLAYDRLERITAAAISARAPGPRYGAGPGPRPARRGTASPPPRSPAAPAALPAGWCSATSTSAAASPASHLAGNCLPPPPCS